MPIILATHDAQPAVTNQITGTICVVLTTCFADIVDAPLAISTLTVITTTIYAILAITDFAGATITVVAAVFSAAIDETRQAVGAVPIVTTPFFAAAAVADLKLGTLVVVSAALGTFTADANFTLAALVISTTLRLDHHTFPILTCLARGALSIVTAPLVFTTETKLTHLAAPAVIVSLAFWVGQPNAHAFEA